MSSTTSRRHHLARHARFSMKEWPMGYDELKAAVELAGGTG